MLNIDAIIMYECFSFPQSIVWTIYLFLFLPAVLLKRGGGDLPLGYCYADTCSKMNRLVVHATGLRDENHQKLTGLTGRFVERLCYAPKIPPRSPGPWGVWHAPRSPSWKTAESPRRFQSTSPRTLVLSPRGSAIVEKGNRDVCDVRSTSRKA